MGLEIPTTEEIRAPGAVLNGFFVPRFLLRIREGFPGCDSVSEDLTPCLLLSSARVGGGVVGDALQGDALLFARADEIELAWGLIDPILTAWEQPKLLLLAAGSPWRYLAGQLLLRF